MASSVRRAALGCWLALFAACRPAAVPYVPPVPGTVYHYTAFSNTITGVDGWRTAYVDDRGRPGSRLGLFITEDPRRPARPDSGALARLWPLRVGSELAFRTQVGPEVWRWEFRVTGTEEVPVPAGRFATVVVQGAQEPALVHDPRAASTVLYTWWYAPRVGAVVRVRSRFLAGRRAGQALEAELERIDSTAATPVGAAR